jgi:hypothetical protein
MGMSHYLTQEPRLLPAGLFVFRVASRYAAPPIWAMPMDEATPFPCPTCGTDYKVVRGEAKATDKSLDPRMRKKAMKKFIAAAALIAAQWQPADAQTILGSIPEEFRATDAGRRTPTTGRRSSGPVRASSRLLP